ncbi:MAG: phosphatidylserine/phosphatidylglycerophosphate/cardiolipin synthase family protein [Spirochaetes bacterium]|nr:phosphatidylserine/phosphatidylglycerophosphate/cardiolipin synthase family protein [Spirochaetota bacterium]
MPLASQFTPLWNRQAEWQARLTMIAAAREFVYLSAFYLENDEYGLTMLAALEAAQKRGVAVTLLLDSFGQRLGGVVMSRAQVEALEQRFAALRSSGGRVLLYNPPRITQRLFGGGQHVKIQVSEHGEAIFASGNITRSSFEAWNEFAVALTGPVVLGLIDTLAALGVTIQPAHRQRLADAMRNETATLDLDYWFYNPNTGQDWLGPFFWQGQNSITERLAAAIDAARTRIALTTFYFRPTQCLMQAILGAAARGVKIEIFHSHRDALGTTDLPWLAAATGYARLLDAGVTIYENRHGEHSKMVLIDGNYAIFGSYNFEDAAHDRLAEAMLATRDARAIKPIQKIFSALRVDSANQRVTERWHKELPLAIRLRMARYGRFKWWI